MPVVRAIKNGHGSGVAEVAPDSYTIAKARELQDVRFVKAPSPPHALPDVEPGTKLDVLHRFVTDDKCPLGAGKLACVLHRNYVIVFAGAKGVAWIKAPSSIVWSANERTRPVI